MDLPVLKGSEKQINWANDIRKVFFDNIDVIREMASKVDSNYIEHFEILIKHFKKEISAKIWIDTFQDITRNNSVKYHILKGIMNHQITGIGAGGAGRVAKKIITDVLDFNERI